MSGYLFFFLESVINRGCFRLLSGNLSGTHASVPEHDPKFQKNRPGVRSWKVYSLGSNNLGPFFFRDFLVSSSDEHTSIYGWLSALVGDSEVPGTAPEHVPEPAHQVLTGIGLAPHAGGGVRKERDTEISHDGEVVASLSCGEPWPLLSVAGGRAPPRSDVVTGRSSSQLDRSMEERRLTDTTPAAPSSAPAPETSTAHVFRAESSRRTLSSSCTRREQRRRVSSPGDW